MADEIKILNNVNLLATPTDNIHITTKGYVDTGLSGKADSDHTHSSLKTTNGTILSPDVTGYTYLITQGSIIPAFDPSLSYSVGDYVTEYGRVYKCTTAHSGNWNASHFTISKAKNYIDDVVSGKADIDHDHHVLKTLNNKTISLEGSPSIDTYLVVQDRFINGFNSSSSYSVGSVVSYVGQFWKCTTAHSGAWNSSHFTKITLKNYIDEVASGKANATHTHSGSDITSGTISTSYLPAADGTSAGIVSVAANSGLVASSGALSVNVTDGNGLSKNATTGAITVRSASTSAYGTVRIASSVASDSSYVVPSSLLYSTLQNYVPTSDLTTIGGSGQNGKVVQLNSNGLIDTTMVPKIAVTDTFTASSESQMTGLTEAEQGDVCIRTDLSKTFILTNNTPGTASNWKELATPADTVTSVNTKTGAVTLTASDVGAAVSNHVHASLKNGATLFSPWLTEDTHAVNMGKIAPKFSESQAYAVGDLCYRNDVFYRCSTAHPAGAWDASHFTSTNIKAYIDDGLSGKSNTDHTHYYLKNGNHTATAPTLSISTYVVIQDKITPSYDSTVTYSAGDTCSRYGRFFKWINASSGSNHAPISSASGSVDSTYWEEIVLTGYIDSQDANLRATLLTENIAETYSASRTYNYGDICSYSGQIYIWANGASGSNHLPTDTDYWSEAVVMDSVDIKMSEHTHSSLKNGSYTVSAPAVSSASYVVAQESIVPVYDNTATYSTGNLCSYNGKVYRYKYSTSSSAKLPTNTTYWEESSLKSYVDTGLAGKAATGHTHNSALFPSLSANSYVLLQSEFAPHWESSNTYSKGDFVARHGRLFMWINDSSGTGSNKEPCTSGTSAVNTTYWQEITISGLKASTTNRGLMQVGSGLSVSDGVVSVSPSAVSGIMGMGVYTKLANLSTPTVALADDTALYKYTIAGNTTLTFDSSNLTMTSGTAITFELYLVMPATVYTVTFPNTVSWLNNETPSMSTKSKTYMLTFRSIDGGATWLGSKEGCY